MNPIPGGKAVSPALEDFIVLNEEIAALVRARIPLESNLSRVGAQLPGKAGELAQRVGRRLDAGESFVSAIDTECARMPPTYRAVLVAGVESGQLGSALEAIVDSASRLEQLRRVLWVAMLYPLILVIVACVLFTLVVKIVAPGFAFLNNSAFRPFEWLTQSQYTVPVLAVMLPILVILAACIWRWRSGRLRSASFPGMGWLSFLTGARTVFRWGEAARFAELLRLLVDRGLPLEKSLQLAGEATGDRRLRTAALQFAERVQSGDMRPEPGRSNRNFESAFPVLIRLALLHSRDRSLLSTGLRQASTMYRERTIRAADWYAEYLPVLLTVVIGGTFTVGFTLFVLWPYIAMLYELAGPGWG